MKRIGLVSLVLVIFWFSSLFASGMKDKLAIGFNVNGQKLYGDTRTGGFEFGGNPLNLRYNFKPYAYLETDIGYSQVSAEFGSNVVSTDMVGVGVKLGYRLFDQSRLNPLFYVGLGALNFKGSNSQRLWDGYGALGGGAEFFLNRFLGLNLTGDYRYTTGDDFDGGNGSAGTDAFLNLSLGINYYIGRRQGYDSDADLTEWIPGQSAPVEEVESENSAIEVAKQFAGTSANEEFKMLTFKRNQLLHSIEQRDKDIRLLQAKVATLNEHTEEVRDKMQMEGLMGSSDSDVKSLNIADSYLVQFRNGLVLYEAGYYENAIDTFNSLLKQNPGHRLASNCWYWLGESYYSTDDFVAAVDAFQNARARNNNSSRSEMILLMLGLSHWRSGNLTQARMDLENLLKSSVTNQYQALASEYLEEIGSN